MNNEHQTPTQCLLAHATETGQRLPASAAKIASEELIGMATELTPGGEFGQTFSPGPCWDAFAAAWLAYQRHRGGNPSYCRLAVAMAKADEHRHDWGHYLTHAAENLEQIHSDGF